MSTNGCEWLPSNPRLSTRQSKPINSDETSGGVLMDTYAIVSLWDQNYRAYSKFLCVFHKFLADREKISSPKPTDWKT